MNSTKPPLIAHRGDASNYPENTIEAFTSAFEHGAQGVELDVQMYKGSLVVVHDFVFGKGNDYNNNEHYPKLAEVLELFAGKGRLELDIKMFSPAFLPHLKKLLDQYASADIEIITNVWPIIPAIRREFPTHMLGVIFPVKEFEDWMSEEFVGIKVTQLMSVMQGDVAHIPSEIIEANPSLVRECHEHAYKIHSHIFKQPLAQEISLYERFRELGIDQCTFEDIELLKNVSKH
jgi:glycerophosphoryl diester phosphodiesterase